MISELRFAQYSNKTNGNNILQILYIANSKSKYLLQSLQILQNVNITFFCTPLKMLSRI